MGGRMLWILKKKSCILFFLRTILTACFFYKAALAQSVDNSFEARMHRIYENYYQRPILDDDWFKMLEGIQEQTYKVNAGDTLWDISEIYFGDGHYWSKLWSVNRNITNPHLLYVGNSIVFSAGNFKTAPSISVEQLEEVIQASQASNPTVVIEEPVVSSQGKYYSKLPDYFVESPMLNLGDQSKITVIPRPPMPYKSDFFLTQEIFSSAPEIVAWVQSIGGDRMVSGESNRIILKTSEGNLSEGATLSIIDDSMDYLKGGYAICVLALIKVVKSIGERQYEAEVLRQFDGLYKGSSVIAHIPSYVNMAVNKSPVELDVSLLSKDKEIWYTGDVIFLKAQSGTLSSGDILKIHNRFDPKIDYYTQNGTLKVVSTKPPFATAVVIHTQTAIDRSSVSAPKKSGFQFW